MKQIKTFYNWGKARFFNREFITFCIIGIINTLINLLVLKGCYLLGLNAGITIQIILATTIAFIVASTFSYFANNFVTFKNKKASVNKFLQTMIAFLIRLFCTLCLTVIFVFIFKVLDLSSVWTGQVAPIISSIIMIPIFYIFLSRILKDSIKKEET